MALAFLAFSTAVNAAEPTKGVIISISGSEAAIDTGPNSGLTPGMVLVVQRLGLAVGTVTLTRVDATTASGIIQSDPGQTVRVLDSVALPASAVPAVAEPKADKPKPAEKPDQPSKSKLTVKKDWKIGYGEHGGDIIPWEHWEYMALSSLAADGLIPGYAAVDFQGPRQFTRRQLAQFTGIALENADKGKRTERNEVLLKRLAQTFRFQPAVRNALSGTGSTLAKPGTELGANRIGYSAFGGLRFQDFKDESEFNAFGRVGGIYDIAPNVFATLSVNNLHRATSALPDKFSELDVLTINARWLDADWEVGKSYWSSGPVASGDGLLSNNSPGLYMVKGRKQISWGRFPGKFTLTQIYGGFQNEGDTKYFGLRRAEFKITERWDLGASEAYIATDPPNPISLVIPYYAYQHTQIFHHPIGGGSGGSNIRNDEFNYMAQIDLTYRRSPGQEWYLEWVIDDIAAPFNWGAGFDAPRKTAVILGVHYPNLFKGRAEGRMEFYLADRDTYEGIAPQVAWEHENLMLGSPFGANTQAFFGRLDYRVSPQIKVHTQLRDALQFRGNFPDMGDRFEWTLGATDSPSPDRSVSLRVIPQRFRGQGYVDRQTAIDVVAACAF